MKKYRFKEVFTDGTHIFVEQELTDRISVFMAAYGLVSHIVSIDYIDVYNEDNKKIATFYH